MNNANGMTVTHLFVGFEGHPLRKDFPLTVCIIPHSNSRLRRISYTFDRDTQKYGMMKNGNV